MGECTSCGGSLTAAAKFCEECGTAVTANSRVAEPQCDSCGASLDTEAKFCGECGSPVDARPPEQTSMKYFGEDNDYLKGECPSCGRILKIRRDSISPAPGGYDLNPPAGIRCSCGAIHHEVEGTAPRTEARAPAADGAPIDWQRAHATEQSAKTQKMNALGSGMQSCGCLLTIFVTIPIIAILAFIGCS